MTPCAVRQQSSAPPSRIVRLVRPGSRLSACRQRDHPAWVPIDHGCRIAYRPTTAPGFRGPMTPTPSDRARAHSGRTAARTHLLLEATLLACRREMAPRHPVGVIVDAHGYNTLAINDFAAHHLIAPGGQVDQVFAATLEGNLEMAARGLAAFSFDALAPTSQLRDRAPGRLRRRQPADELTTQRLGLAGVDRSGDSLSGVVGGGGQR